MSDPIMLRCGHCADEMSIADVSLGEICHVCRIGGYRLPPAVASPGERGRDDLEWLVANDASFGRSTSMVVDEEGSMVERASIFCRVPCRNLYEWHCYDGQTWREALQAAREAGPCVGALGECSKSNFGTGDEHPIVVELESLRAQVSRLESELSEAKADRERLGNTIVTLTADRDRWVKSAHELAAEVDAIVFGRDQ